MTNTNDVATFPSTDHMAPWEPPPLPPEQPRPTPTPEVAAPATKAGSTIAGTFKVVQPGPIVMPPAELVPADTAHETADAIEALNSAAALWRSHATQIRTTAEISALQCEKFAAALTEEGARLAGIISAFRAYIVGQENDIAKAHEALSRVSTRAPEAAT
jgi:hypothetical protein